MPEITWVCDANPQLDESIDAIAPYIKSGVVTSLRPAQAMGDGMECSVTQESRAAVVAALNAAGFRIIEGGQR